MSAGEFHRLTRNATADVVAFARCVAQTEFLFDDAGDADALAQYRAAWFDAEILNALALERWDSDGRPVDWSAVWHAEFARAAAQTVAALQAVVALHFKPAK